TRCPSRIIVLIKAKIDAGAITVRAANEAEIIDVLVGNRRTMRARIIASPGTDRCGCAAKCIRTKSAVLQPAREIRSFEILADGECKVESANPTGKLVHHVW